MGFVAWAIVGSSPGSQQRPDRRTSPHNSSWCACSAAHPPQTPRRPCFSCPSVVPFVRIRQRNLVRSCHTEHKVRDVGGSEVQLAYSIIECLSRSNLPAFEAFFSPDSSQRLLRTTKNTSSPRRHQLVDVARSVMLRPMAPPTVKAKTDSSSLESYARAMASRVAGMTSSFDEASMRNSWSWQSSRRRLLSFLCSQVC